MIVTVTGLWISLAVSLYGAVSLCTLNLSLTEFLFTFTLYLDWSSNDFWRRRNYEMKQSIQLNVWRARCTLVFSCDISGDLRFSQQGKRRLMLRFEHCKNYEVSQSLTFLVLKIKNFSKEPHSSLLKWRCIPSVEEKMAAFLSRFCKKL